MTKPFVPKPFEAGAAITWRHSTSSVTSVERAGVVWDRGPTVAGTSMTAWVIPDVALPGDLYSAILVGKSNCRHDRGAAYSDDGLDSPLGSATAAAARVSVRTRAAQIAA